MINKGLQGLLKHATYKHNQLLFRLLKIDKRKTKG